MPRMRRRIRRRPPSRSIATACPRWRWTRGWSRSPTTSPTGCASTASVPALYEDLFERTIAFVDRRQRLRVRAVRPLPALDALRDRSATTCRSPGVRSSRRSRCSATSRSSSRGSMFDGDALRLGQRPGRRARALRAADARVHRRRALRSSTSLYERPLRGFRARRDARSVLIVGAGDGGRLLLREILRNPELGYRPVGFIDDDPRKQGARIDRGARACSARPSELGRGARGRRARRGADRDPVGAGHDARPRRRARAASAACRCARCRPCSSCCRPAGRLLRQVREVEVEDVLGREPVRMDLDRVGGYLTGRVVLVTGAGGSIGSELCRQIARVGPSRLVLLDHAEDNLFEIRARAGRGPPRAQHRRRARRLQGGRADARGVRRAPPGDRLPRRRLQARAPDGGEPGRGGAQQRARHARDVPGRGRVRDRRRSCSSRPTRRSRPRR